MSLHLLKRESLRLYEDISSLPIPENLEEAEQFQYMELLSQQAAPYQKMSEQVGGQYENFWANEKVWEQIQEQYISSARVIQKRLSHTFTFISSCGS